MRFVQASHSASRIERMLFWPWTQAQVVRCVGLSMSQSAHKHLSMVAAGGGGSSSSVEWWTCYLWADLERSAQRCRGWLASMSRDWLTLRLAIECRLSLAPPLRSAPSVGSIGRVARVAHDERSATPISIAARSIGESVCRDETVSACWDQPLAPTHRQIMQPAGILYRSVLHLAMSPSNSIIAADAKMIDAWMIHDTFLKNHH